MPSAWSPLVVRGRRAVVLGALVVAAFAAAAPVLAQPVLRISAIPDESPTELQRKFGQLAAYLESQLGMKVAYTPVSDYAAAVEALVGKKLDMVWYGGFTFVQARQRSGNQVIPLVQRAEDEKFRSVFITRADAGIKSLADLKGKTVSFGSPSSTSGHLMPRYFLVQQGIEPDRDFRQVAFSGAHDATIAAVAGGKVQAGALNISVWEKFVQDKRVDTSQVVVFYTTPPYYDYNWTVRSDLDPALRNRIADAFLRLDPSKPDDKAILDLQRASRFIPTRSENYDSIERAAKSAGLIK
ncbi:MAG: putative selenate ABC transporter substrate-binding protein [Burkholderiaceae bacterium]|jgi:phosphonate transport system substrate-binding protein|nr:putative selenate ABC transporter substrate-binding protein [Burkholderiaceae bacterium]